MTWPRFRHSSAAVRPGDARADDHHVDLGDPARRLGGQPLRQPGQGRAGRTAQARRTRRRAPWEPCFRIGRWRQPRARVGGPGGTSPLHAPRRRPNARVWFDAWLESAYGADGFWRRHWPDEHFRTAAATSPLFAEAVAAVASRIGVDAVVDVGAGRGDLLTGLAGSAAALRLAGIDLRSAARGRCPPTVDWAEDLWDVRYGRWTTGQAEALAGRGRSGAGRRGRVAGRPARARGDPGRRRLAGGRGRGAGRRGAARAAADRRRTSSGPTGGGRRASGPRSGRPATGPGRRWRRWSDAVVAVCCLVDYGHDREHRPAEGSFAAYRDGRQVPPMPSTEMNLTAHVSLDAVRAAGETAGLRTVLDALQDEALARLLTGKPPRCRPAERPGPPQRARGPGVGVRLGHAPLAGPAPLTGTRRAGQRRRRRTAKAVTQAKPMTTATKSRTLCSGPNGSGSRRQTTATTTRDHRRGPVVLRRRSGGPGPGRPRPARGRPAAERSAWMMLEVLSCVRDARRARRPGSPSPGRP